MTATRSDAPLQEDTTDPLALHHQGTGQDTEVLVEVEAEVVKIDKDEDKIAVAIVHIHSWWTDSFSG
jgi:hypothetical protein